MRTLFCSPGSRGTCILPCRGPCKDLCLILRGGVLCKRDPSGGHSLMTTAHGNHNVITHLFRCDQTALLRFLFCMHIRDFSPSLVLSLPLLDPYRSASLTATRAPGVLESAPPRRETILLERTSLLELPPPKVPGNRFENMALIPPKSPLGWPCGSGRRARRRPEDEDRAIISEEPVR